MNVVLFLFSILIASISYAETSPKCPGEEGYYFKNYKRRNPIDGGFVANTAFVDDSADDLYIAPTAAVCGFASIEDVASIRGNVLITGNAVISDYAVIQGNIIVNGDSVISGKSRITGNGILTSVNIKDENRNLTDVDPFKPAMSSYDLFLDLQKFIRDYASKFNASGWEYSTHFSGGRLEKQDISFEGSPCTLKIIVDRKPTIPFCKYGRSANFNGLTEDFFNLWNVSNIRLSLQSPELTLIKFDGGSIKSRSWHYNTCTFEPDQFGWSSWQSNYESPLEAPTKAIAEKIAEKFQALVNSCKK